MSPPPHPSSSPQASSPEGVPGRIGAPRPLLVVMMIAAAVFILSFGALLFLLAKNRKPPSTDPIASAGSGAGAGGPVIRVDGPRESGDPLKPDEFAEGLFIPAFQVVDHDSKPVTKDVFNGKITVIDFFFTHCPFICPAMSGAMGQRTRDLKDVPEVQFLSFSVDPVHDTPERLREYATDLKADTTRWRFLTGEKSQIWNILSDGLKWGVEDRPDQPIKLPDGSEMANIKHPGWFALIGPDGRVLGIYDFSSEEKQYKLIDRVRAMSKAMQKR